VHSSFFSRKVVRKKPMEEYELLILQEKIFL